GVLAPSSSRLIDTARKGEAVLSRVLDDPDFGVIDSFRRSGIAVPISWNCDLHRERSVRNHPRQQFQALPGSFIRWIERDSGEFRLYQSTQIVALAYGFNLGWIERATYNQAHVAGVGD